MTRPDRCDAAAFAHAARVANLRAHAEGRRHLGRHSEYYPRRLRHYGWQLTETTCGTDPVVIASGRTFTREGCDRAWYRAYLVELRAVAR